MLDRMGGGDLPHATKGSVQLECWMMYDNHTRCHGWLKYPAGMIHGSCDMLSKNENQLGIRCSHDSLFIHLLLPLPAVRDWAVLPVGMVAVATKEQLLLK